MAALNNVNRKDGGFNESFLRTATAEQIKPALAQIEQIAGEPGIIEIALDRVRFCFYSEVAAYRFAFWLSNTPGVYVRRFEVGQLVRFEVGISELA
jgi:hypothetical protein